MSAPTLTTLASDAPASPRLASVTAALLFAASFLLYLPSLFYDFVAYDDLRIVLDHPNLYDEHSLLASLHQILVGYFPREEPLLVRDLSWALNSRLFGFRNPFGYHLGNVLLNAADTALLYLFLLAATRRHRFAALVTALFAVLPVHVEPVCWVMGRKDVLCAFFVLAILLLEAQALDAPERRRRWLRLVAFALYPLAILSKFSAVSLVLVLAAYRLLGPSLRPLSSPDRLRPARELLGLVPHMIVSLWLYVWYNRILAAFGVIGGSSVPPGEHLLDLVRFIPLVIGLYVASLFSSGAHSIAYLFPHESIPLAPLEQAAGLAIGAALLAFLIWAARRRRDLLFYGLGFLALLLPYFNIVVVILWRADRYVYLASFCVLAVLVQLGLEALPRLGPRVRLAIPAAAGAWILLAAGATLGREPAFRDNHALWSYEVGLARPQPVAFQALAKSFIGKASATGDPAEKARLLDEAERVAREGLRYYESIPWRPPPGAHLAPRLDYANLHVQLGRAAWLRGAPLPVQIDHYRRSYAIAPTSANTLLLAQTLFDQAAATHDEATARASLRYYGEYIANVRVDVPRRAHLNQVLDTQYVRVFPALATAVETLKRAYLR
jgi:hypothetical protein